MECIFTCTHTTAHNAQNKLFTHSVPFLTQNWNICQSQPWCTFPIQIWSQSSLVSLYSSHRTVPILYYEPLLIIKAWETPATLEVVQHPLKLFLFLNISKSDWFVFIPVTWSRVIVMTIHHINTHSTLHSHHHECLAHEDTYYISTSLEIWIINLNMVTIILI